MYKLTWNMCFQLEKSQKAANPEDRVIKYSCSEISAEADLVTRALSIFIFFLLKGEFIGKS